VATLGYLGFLLGPVLIGAPAAQEFVAEVGHEAQPPAQSPPSARGRRVVGALRLTAGYGAVVLTGTGTGASSGSAV